MLSGSCARGAVSLPSWARAAAGPAWMPAGRQAALAGACPGSMLANLPPQHGWRHLMPASSHMVSNSCAGSSMAAYSGRESIHTLPTVL